MFEVKQQNKKLTQRGTIADYLNKNFVMLVKKEIRFSHKNARLILASLFLLVLM